MRRAVLTGSAFGTIAAVLMMLRLQIDEGVWLDSRVVPVALVGLFEGGSAGFIAAVVAVAYRIWLGGVGTVASVLTLLATACAAALACAWARRDRDVGPRHALALSLAVYALLLAGFTLLGARGLEIIGRAWLHLLGVTVIGIGVVARLFHDVVAEARFAEEHARFRAIIDEASDAIRIVDPDTFRILDVNRRDCELSGYPRSALIGRDVRDFWPEEPELRALRETSIAEARAHGFARAFGNPYRRASGDVIRVDSTRRIVDHDGRRYEIVIYRESVERENAEAAQRQAEDLRAITLVASAAAHEINNPLTVIVGSLELFSRRVAIDAQERRWLDRAAGAAQRIRDIVGRMTRITRIERTPPRPGLPPMLDIHKSSDVH